MYLTTFLGVFGKGIMGLMKATGWIFANFFTNFFLQHTALGQLNGPILWAKHFHCRRVTGYTILIFIS
jgi:hypothetical protein